MTMESVEVPKLKGQILSEKINVAVEPELKARLQRLKSDHKIDVPRWIRGLIKQNIEQLESSADAV